MNEPSVYKTIKNMDIGEIKMFGVEKWGCARTVASQMKKVFGSTFKVRRIRKGDIKVIRLS